jgi:hypothetical protein
MNPGELCRVLLAGSVPAVEVPELADEKTRAQVRQRLGEVGCALAYAPRSDRWVVSLEEPLAQLEDHALPARLGDTELAVLAACWLQLCFLPAEQGRQPGARGADDEGEPWADHDDLVAQLSDRLGGPALDAAIGRLCAAGYLLPREGQLFAGPLLETLEDTGASEEARALLVRHQRLMHLRRRAAELEAEVGIPSDHGASYGTDPGTGTGAGLPPDFQPDWGTGTPSAGAGGGLDA